MKTNKRNFLIAPGLATMAAALLSALSAAAEIVITAPKEGETVCQLFPAQLKFATESQAERDKYFDGAEHAKALKTDGARAKPIDIAWTGRQGACKVTVKRLPDGKVFFEGQAKGGKTQVDSLEIARDWELTVSDGKGAAKVLFKTQDQAPRIVNFAKKVRNCRDIGGRIGLNGRRIKQGLVFRSQGLNDNAKTNATDKGVVRIPGKTRLTEDERQTILSRWGIRTDLDLRSDKECFGMTGSPLGADVKWVHISYTSYKIERKDCNEKVFKVFLDPKNYPIVFHCIGGADRTGTVAILLEALVGVDENNLWMDYLTTGFTGVVSDPRHKKSVTRVFDGLMKFPGETWAQRAEGYFKSIGYTDADITALRDFLLED